MTNVCCCEEQNQSEELRVYDWALLDNTDKIPKDKLPNDVYTKDEINTIIGPIGPVSVKSYVDERIATIDPQAPIEFPEITIIDGYWYINGLKAAKVTGDQGTQGPQGDKGDQGDQGPQGNAGKSAYEIAKDNGFIGTEAQWLESLTPKISINSEGYWCINDENTGVKAKGEKGSPGANGESGTTIEVINDHWIINGRDYGPIRGAEGRGIRSIRKTGEDGLTNIYTITYTDGSWETFTVTNGKDGENGRDGIDGKDGKDGEDGIGIPGAPGTNTYFHVAYANKNSHGDIIDFSTTDPTLPNGGYKEYMGTYVDNKPLADDPLDYTWILIKGAQGADGTNGIPGAQGPQGEAGPTQYLHIKYSNDGGHTFTENNGETPGYYLGQYVDFKLLDSTIPGDYTWALIKGADGKDGKDGIGINVKGSVDSESELPQSGNEAGDAYFVGEYIFVWTGTTWKNMGRIAGNTGQSVTLYVHIAYANSSDGTEGFSTTKLSNVDYAYIGICVNEEQEDPIDSSKYEWSLIRGKDGEDGKDGNSIEFVYTRNNTGEAPDAPETNLTDDWYGVSNGITWTDNPQGVQANLMYEYVSVREKKNNTWLPYSPPVIWSKWGEKGKDGDGYEYIYKRYTEIHDFSNALDNPHNWENNPAFQVDGYFKDGWYDDPLGVSSDYRVEYVSTRKKKDGLWLQYSQPALWSLFVPKGSDGGRYLYLYYSSSDKNTIPNYKSEEASISDLTDLGWSRAMPNYLSGVYIWMIQAFFESEQTKSIWTSPIRITGDDGKVGEDGNSTEYIYKTFTTKVTNWENDLDNPATWDAVQSSDYFGPNGHKWNDNPQGIDLTNKFEYVSTREYKLWSSEDTEKKWGKFTTPVLWSNWGEKGLDGDGFEYIYKHYQQSQTFRENDGREDNPYNWSISTNEEYFGPVGQLWDDDPVGVSSAYLYEYVSKRKRTSGEWGRFSVPALWSRYATQGSNGGQYELRYCIYNPTTEHSLPPVPTEGSDGIGLFGEEGWTAYWDVTSDDPPSGYYKYLSQCFMSGEGLYGKWLSPLRISGEKGEPGIGITIDHNRSSVLYCRSNSGTVAPTTGWSNNIPAIDNSKNFLWTKTVITYSDNSSTTSYSVSYSGGVSIDRTEVKYVLTSSSIQPNDNEFTSTSIPQLLLGKYLWVRAIVKYTDGTELKSYSVSRIGSDGEDGQKGADGLVPHFAYSTSDNGSENFSLTSFEGATYIGVCVNEDRDDPITYTDYQWTKIKGDKGDPGEGGGNISETIEYIFNQLKSDSPYHIVSINEYEWDSVKGTLTRKYGVESTEPNSKFTKMDGEHYEVFDGNGFFTVIKCDPIKNMFGHYKVLMGGKDITSLVVQYVAKNTDDLAYFDYFSSWPYALIDVINETTLYAASPSYITPYRTLGYSTESHVIESTAFSSLTWKNSISEISSNTGYLFSKKTTTILIRNSEHSGEYNIVTYSCEKYLDSDTTTESTKVEYYFTDFKDSYPYSIVNYSIVSTSSNYPYLPVYSSKYTNGYNEIYYDDETIKTVGASFGKVIWKKVTKTISIPDFVNNLTIESYSLIPNNKLPTNSYDKLYIWIPSVTDNTIIITDKIENCDNYEVVPDDLGNIEITDDVLKPGLSVKIVRVGETVDADILNFSGHIYNWTTSNVGYLEISNGNSETERVGLSYYDYYSHPIFKGLTASDENNPVPIYGRHRYSGTNNTDFSGPGDSSYTYFGDIYVVPKDVEVITKLEFDNIYAYEGEEVYPSFSITWSKDLALQSTIHYLYPINDNRIISFTLNDVSEKYSDIVNIIGNKIKAKKKGLAIINGTLIYSIGSINITEKFQIRVYVTDKLFLKNGVDLTVIYAIDIFGLPISRSNTTGPVLLGNASDNRINTTYLMNHMTVSDSWLRTIDNGGQIGYSFNRNNEWNDIYFSILNFNDNNVILNKDSSTGLGYSVSSFREALDYYSTLSYITSETLYKGTEDNPLKQDLSGQYYREGEIILNALDGSKLTIKVRLYATLGYYKKNTSVSENEMSWYYTHYPVEICGYRSVEVVGSWDVTKGLEMSINWPLTIVIPENKKAYIWANSSNNYLIKGIKNSFIGERFEGTKYSKMTDFV